MVENNKINFKQVVGAKPGLTPKVQKATIKSKDTSNLRNDLNNSKKINISNQNRKEKKIMTPNKTDKINNQKEKKDTRVENSTSTPVFQTVPSSQLTKLNNNVEPKNVENKTDKQEFHNLNNDKLKSSENLDSVSEKRGNKEKSKISFSKQETNSNTEFKKEIVKNNNVVEEKIETDESKNQKIDLPTLSQYGFNLTEKYRNSEDFAPVLARDLETRDLLGIIVQRYKNNAILVGEAGTGKTAIVEGLAQLLAVDAVPTAIKGFDLWELDIPALSNKDTSDGGYHFRIKKIVEEVKRAKNIILFVDETHVILDKGGELDAGDLIKPALARGELRMIGSTTDWEYHKYIEQDKALVRRYQRVTVQELGRDDTIRILKSRKRSLESFHGVTITSKAIEAAVDLSTRYLPSRRNPDKSIDILDKACALTRLSIDSMPKELKLLQGEVVTLEADYELEDDEEKKELILQELNFKKPLFEQQVNVWKKQKEVLEFLGVMRGKLSILENQIAFYEQINQNDNSEENLLKLSKLKAEYDKGEGQFNQLKTAYYNQVNLMLKDEVDVEGVQRTIEATTGIPISDLTESEFDRLRSMDKTLSRRVIGQKHAIKTVSYAIKRSRLGVSKTDQPIGAFIFLGPSGVGKALSVYEPIATPDRGFVPMGRLAVGDFVFDRFGKPTKVLGVFPQGEREFYSIKLDDSRVLSADKEHLFTVKIGRKKKLKTVTVKEIISLLEEKQKVSIPTGGAIEFDSGSMDSVESLYFAVGKHTQQITSAIKFTKLSQRIDVLRGAFDNYGLFDGHRFIFKASGKEKLVADVREVLFSVGVQSRLIDKETIEIMYRNKDEVFNLVGSKKMRDLAYINIPFKSPYGNQDFVEIESISKIPGLTEAVCILVDNDEHLFLAGKDLVVTHNTELVKALAQVQFGDERKMKRFDCGELKSISSVSRLIGAPPGEDKNDTGGELTEYVKKNPYSLILFDEAEKAHPGIFDVLLSVLDDGEVADSRGDVVDFTNTIIVFTSNIASQTILRGQDLKTGELPPEVVSVVKAQLRNPDPEKGGRGFKPEFVNRLDATVIFYKLERHELEKIANLKLLALKKRLMKSRKIRIVYGEKIHETFRETEPPNLDVAWLLSSHYKLPIEELDLGGRPIDRLIVSEVEDPLTDLLLEEGVPDGSFILVEATYPRGSKVYVDENGAQRPVPPIVKLSVISEDEYNQKIVVDPVEHQFD